MHPGGGTSADPADPSDPASHRFPQQRIRFEICLCPLLKILWSYRFHQLLWTWLFQTQLFQVLWSWIFQVLWSHRQLGLLLWIPEFRCFRVDNHLLCGLPTSAFHCCCCGSGPGWFQEELQCFPGKCQQGARGGLFPFQPFLIQLSNLLSMPTAQLSTTLSTRSLMTSNRTTLPVRSPGSRGMRNAPDSCSGMVIL